MASHFPDEIRVAVEVIEDDETSQTQPIDQNRAPDFRQHIGTVT